MASERRPEIRRIAMSIDFSLLYLLLNNISIFVVMVVGYSYLVDYLQSEPWLFRQLMLGALFGAIVFVSMHVQIPAAEGVVVDQRNAIIVLAGAYGGPVCGAVAMIVAALYRISLGGIGTFAGVVGLTLSLCVGSALYRFGWHRHGSLHLLVASAVAVALTSPGFLFVGDLQNGWALLKRMAAPWGTALFVGIFLGGMLLTREDRRLAAEREKKRSEVQFRALFHSSEVSIWNQDFSRIHARLQQLRDQGVTDLRDHIARDPGVVDELAALSQVTLVNQAALRLYGVSSEEAFKANQAAMIGGGRPTVIADLLHAIWEGKPSFRAEDTHVTRSGREL
ncbi:MAG: PAS domain-containing protein, partial [bacterium]|nr:PAS domain-containing protein [bacterium]